jgi:branched-chain amino acid transport system permease protein
MFSNPNDPPVLAAFKDSLLVGVIALLIFGPISGIILDGYSFNTHFKTPLILATIVFAGRFAYQMAMLTPWGQKFLERLALSKGKRSVYVGSPNDHKYLWIILLVLFAAGLILPFYLSKYALTVAILAIIYVLLGLGLNIVVGLAGLLDLGFVAFYAVGAYTFALGSQYIGLGFWTAIPVAAALAAIFGGILGFPVLRMHGDYLAIVTLGFGEIIRLVLNNWTSFTGGPNGAKAAEPTLFGLEFTRTAKTEGHIPFHEFFGTVYNPNTKFIFLYIVVFLMACLMIFFFSRLRSMPMGRAWEALREDEIACRSLGINHVIVKLSAFMMGAMTGGIGGVFFAAQQGGFVNPTSFTFFESALILAIVVLGGMGSTVGVVIAALVLTLLPEVLRDFSDYRVLVFGGLMIFMMLWKPRGFLSIRRPYFSKEGQA